MNFLEIGKIVKTRGLKGSVKVLSYLESDELLRSLEEVFIRRSGNETVRFCLKSFEVKGPCFYLDMDGVNSFEQAQALVGCKVLVPIEKLKVLPEGEYYWQELIGLTVITEEGYPVGQLKSIFPTGSNDVYVCSEGKKEILLPAIEDVVRKIDLEKGMMIVRLPKGL